MEYPPELRYTSEDEWIRVEDGDGIVGITDFAQDQLGDVVYLELPEAGRQLSQGDAFGVIESVKAVSDLYAPVSGEVLARNEDAVASPELVNQSPYTDGWLIRVRLSDPTELDGLMDADAYQRQLPEE